MTVDDLVAHLRDSPVHPDVARLNPAQGGVPNEPGVYAWWSDEDALPGVSLPKGAGDDRWLLYIGIAPSRPGSRQALRGRVCGNHLRGNIGSSTFRRSLAALLWQREGWTLTRRGEQALLAPASNEALSTWQREHLSVSWIVRRNPWEVEARIIKAMAPPLNLAQNRQHAYGWTLSEARQRLRSAALSTSASPPGP
jgi:hypothetical protein